MTENLEVQILMKWVRLHTSIIYDILELKSKPTREIIMFRAQRI